MKSLTLLGFMIFSLSACSGGDKVSFETQEDARRQARENSEYNAKNWRDANQPNGKLLLRGDSSINSTCATGDGWATVDVKENGYVTELKCSTVSDTIGCLTTADFKSKSYAKEDGNCNKELPFPLPKIIK